MAKLLGYRPEGQAHYPLSWLARQQETRLLGYEPVGRIEREYSPYAGVGALGQFAPEQEFDLNDPVRTLELKRALVALAQRDGAQATRSQQIVLDGPLAVGWEAAAADEFVLALSRYAAGSRVSGPYTQLRALPGGRHGIVGGPQPTPAGLEVIAGAVEERLDGQPRMTEYLNWRSDMFDPPHELGPPRGGIVVPNSTGGAPHQPDGYTHAFERRGTPEQHRLIEQLDDNLVHCWEMLLQPGINEQQRALLLNDCVIRTRQARHDAVLALGGPGTCPTGQMWQEISKSCVSAPSPCPPGQERDPGSGECKSVIGGGDVASMLSRPLGAFAVGAVVGLGAWYANKKWGKKRG